MTTVSNAPTTAMSSESEKSTSESLPKLSAADFKLYNKLAEMMQYYHNHFRQTWNTLYKACENNKRPQNLSINQFINLGLQFCQRLTLHHDIEEHHIFPILARKMTEFSHSKNASDPRARLMVLQHKQIHAGLERLEKYLGDCRTGMVDFRLTSGTAAGAAAGAGAAGDRNENQGVESLKDIMDSFGRVLWLHLDEEVRLLGAENMRLYWNKEEMNGFNF